MLRKILSLIQEAGGIPLTVQTISRQLGISHDMADQLVRTLVQRGRLIEVVEGCNGCSVCPLKVVCSGAPEVSVHGYALSEQTKTPVTLAA